MPKIKNIEFLRIVACLAIILLHLFNKARLHGLFGDIEIYNKLWVMTSNGQKAVDLFFIISGFFFALKFNQLESIWEFLKHKFIRLYPVLVFGFIAYFLVSLTGAVKFTFYDNILNFLCLNGTLLVLKVGNLGQFWYVSAMLWAFVIYSYLLKNYRKENANLLIALLVFFSYGFIIHAKGGAINSHEQTFYNIFNVGMMRAFGGVGIGYFIAQWYQANADKIKNITLTLYQKIAITALEFICIFFIINNLMLHKIHYKNHIIFIIVFAVALMLFLIRQGYVSRLLNSDCWQNLSKYTYSLYMTHIFIFDVFKGSIWKYHTDWVYAYPILNVLFALLAALVFGIFTYHFIEKPATAYLLKRMENRAVIGGGGNPFICLPLQNGINGLCVKRLLVKDY